MSKESKKSKFDANPASLSIRCGNCGEEILQKNPNKCPYCGSSDLISVKDAISDLLAEIKKLEKAGKYEDAALKYEEIEMWDKAEEIRKINVGKVISITVECPHCGEAKMLSSRSNEVQCKHCNKRYTIPKKVLELL